MLLLLSTSADYEGDIVGEIVSVVLVDDILDKSYVNRDLKTVVVVAGDVDDDKVDDDYKCDISGEMMTDVVDAEKG